MFRFKTLFCTLFFYGLTLCFALPVFAQIDLDFSEDPSDSTNNSIDVKKSFSENLDNTTDNSSSNGQESWLKSLINKGTSELFPSQNSKEAKAEQQRQDQVLMNRKSNAANFDISGIKLRMSPEEVAKVLLDRGYKRTFQTTHIPNFIEWRYIETCRLNGVIGYDRLLLCARQMAKRNGYQYIGVEKYYKQASRENIEVNYTSTFTDNLSHHIIYKSDIPLSTSLASNNVYINNLKIMEFWRRIDLRYGQPDNVSLLQWGLGGKKPYLKAFPPAKGGLPLLKLELVDPLLKDLDTSRMVNEDVHFVNTEYYSF